MTSSSTELPADPAGAGPVAHELGLSRQWRDLVLMLVLTVTLATAGLAGYGISAREHHSAALPTDTGPDAGFVRDMQVHHAQAVLMATIVRDSTTDPAIRYLAYDILTSQQGQIGMMQGWLTEWGLTQSNTDLPAMSWMSGSGNGDDHGGMQMPAGTNGSLMRLQPDGRMPGMATAADLDRLRALSGRASEIRFLQMMIPHHRGGVAMAQACEQLCQRPSVRLLAENIAAGQTSEIQAMTDLLAARGARP